jgi:hypothetical protein
MSLLQPTSIAALLLITLAFIFGVGGYRLGLWSDNTPGPGLLPLAAALILLPLVGLMLREDNADQGPFRAAPLSAVILMCIYAAVLPRAGFLLPTFVLVLAWVRIFHGQGWVRASLLSMCLSAAGVGLFGVLLKVPMPLVPGWP